MLRTMADEAKRSEPSLRKALGVFDGIAILIGITIGAGIYSTPQIIASYLSSFSLILLLWILAGVFVFISGLIYAELGTRMPNTGGEYVYISRCFGPYIGFMFGWAQLFIIRTSAAAALALIVADYLGHFFTLNRAHRIFVALAVIFLFGVLNYIGIQRASVFQKLSTILKAGALLSIVIFGFVFSGGHENLLFTRAAPEGGLDPLRCVVAALMLIIFSHTGWERVGYSAGEMKNPRRVIPVSLVFGIGIVVLLYALTNMTYHRVLGMDGMRESTIVASDVLTVLIGPIGAALIAVLVIISATGSINGTMMTATRAYYAMAKDRLFFKWLDHVHSRFRTPSRAIVAHCLWAGAILIIRGTFETIAAGLAFAILIFYGLSTLALFKMRRDRIGGTNVFRVPLYPFLPLLSLFLIIGLIILRVLFFWQQSLVDLAFILTGIPFAFYWCRKRGASTRMNTKNSKIKYPI
ncbi:MAG: amino acid permease [Candidatus Aminicenantes bacterium]|nr:amino acid permease [Candidatus Aminicenantes bacterium]